MVGLSENAVSQLIHWLIILRGVCPVCPVCPLNMVIFHSYVNVYQRVYHTVILLFSSFLGETKPAFRGLRWNSWTLPGCQSGACSSTLMPFKYIHLGQLPRDPIASWLVVDLSLRKILVSWDYYSEPNFCHFNVWLPEGISLVGGFNDLEKYDFVNGKDDIPCMENKSHVPNHQKFMARNVGFSRDTATCVGEKKRKWNWTKPEVRQVRPVETFL